jgi:hypothetical protein
VGQLLVDDGFVVRQAGRQRPVGVRLLLQVLGLLLGDGDGIGAGDEAARRLLLGPCIARGTDFVAAVGYRTAQEVTGRHRGLVGPAMADLAAA